MQAKKGFVYTARQNGSFSRAIPEQCTEKRPYRVVCLYTVAVCKLAIMSKRMCFLLYKEEEVVSGTLQQ